VKVNPTRLGICVRRLGGVTIFFFGRVVQRWARRDACDSDSLDSGLAPWPPLPHTTATWPARSFYVRRSIFCTAIRAKDVHGRHRLQCNDSWDCQVVLLYDVVKSVGSAECQQCVRCTYFPFAHMTSVALILPSALTLQYYSPGPAGGWLGWALNCKYE
jgi:hypothetical protein